MRRVIRPIALALSGFVLLVMVLAQVRIVTIETPWGDVGMMPEGVFGHTKGGDWRVVIVEPLATSWYAGFVSKPVVTRFPQMGVWVPWWLVLVVWFPMGGWFWWLGRGLRRGAAFPVEGVERER